MKKLITIAIIASISTAIQMIHIFPWWTFLIIVFLLGIALPLEKWKVPSFFYGFISGFLVWLLSTLYFESAYNGKVMAPIALTFEVSPYILYLVIGLIGGLLTGLALYSGAQLRKGREVLKLEISEED